MKSNKALAIFALSCIFLVACNDSPVTPNTTPTPPIPTAEVRVIHASPDAPLVDVFSGTSAIDELQNVDYQVGSGFLELIIGQYNLAVQAETPAGNVEVLTLIPTLEADNQYNILAVGDVAAIETLVVANPSTEIGSGNIRVQVVHGAPDAPTVDIYITAAGTDLSAETPTATLSFKDFTGQVEVPAGDYQVRITAAGATDVLYDSGTLPLAAGADLLVTATENVASGNSPVALLVADGMSSSVILDKDTTADIRVIHGIADAPAVDVFAVVDDADDILLFDGAPFKGVTDYAGVAPGSYVLDVVADADNSIVAIDNVSANVTAGVRYTALANNTLANADLDFIVDSARPLATAAQVRIFHASQATGPVDIYVTADGAIDNVEPNFAGVSYSTDELAETGYVQLPAGDYFVTVTATGSKDAAIETGMLSLEAAKIYTAIAVDGDMTGMGPQLILADDLAPSVTLQ